ncbi:hypothetical protein WJX73_009027 [Symbiochloris irregularis]|uniref:Uncharacterized protein n=1 Tax=Symbiochloris irregularis TaxID=706552 RepID=A0AAW1NPF7_9CHLO
MNCLLETLGSLQPRLRRSCATPAVAFVVAAIPALLEARRTAIQTQQLLAALEKELPETAAAMRLASLEMADCIEEFSGLSNDISTGVRASAAMLTGTHTNLQQGGALLGTAVNSLLLPELRKRSPALRDSLEAQLLATSRMRHNVILGGQMAAAASLAMKRAKVGMASVGLMQRAGGLLSFTNARWLQRARLRQRGSVLQPPSV